MAIRRDTLRRMHRLATTVGGHADTTTRTLTAAWVRAWDELESAWRTTVTDLVTKAAADGQWPAPWQMARVETLAAAVVATGNALDDLTRRAQETIGTGTAAVVSATGDGEPALMASQLPSALAAAAAAGYAAKVTPTALDVIVRRAGEQVTALTRPLSAQALEAVRRALIRGVAIGDHPTRVAADMLRRVQGGFNGGLDRAIVIARTEQLDAYRTASGYVHASNADVLDGWIWHASLGTRCCPSCWGLHGTVHPLDEPGPLDHQQGRCTRLPKLRPWRDLGISLDEPADQTVDARAKWLGLSRADQDAVFGPARAELVRTGQVAWADLAVRRTTPGWRASYAPTPVRDLRQAADRTAA